MSTTTNPSPIEPFDFTKPGSLSSENADQWQQWLDNFTDFSEKWFQLSNVETRIRILDQMALSFDAVRQRIPRPAIACGLAIGDSRLPTLLVFDRSLALGLVLQLLGQQQSEAPEDRAMSSIEFSLCEMLFRRIVDSISESWPHKEPLACEMQEMDLLPHRSRLWDPRKMVFLCSFGFSIGDDSHRCLWILPHDELEKLLEQPGARHVEATAASRQQMQQRVFDVSVPVTVELGRTEVPVSRLANLSAGDILVFEQRITDPLPLVISNKIKFYGWLGRTGNRHAFKISEVQ